MICYVALSTVLLSIQPAVTTIQTCLIVSQKLLCQRFIVADSTVKRYVFYEQ